MGVLLAEANAACHMNGSPRRCFALLFLGWTVLATALLASIF